MSKPKVSFILPAYNEEAIIEKTLHEVVNYFRDKKFSTEIIVVDDGSVDATSKMVKEKFKQVTLVKLSENRGKGAAIKAGVKKAEGEFIFFSDADLSVPMKFFDIFLDKLKAGTEVVIGSRRLKESDIIKHQPFFRESMGRVYTLLSKVVTGLNLSDFTCGFKGFSRSAAKEIFSQMRLSRWAYDSEILFLANKFGYKVIEIPVSWENREQSRVHIGSAVFKSFSDLLMIRINNIRGLYDISKK